MYLNALYSVIKIIELNTVSCKKRNNKIKNYAEKLVCGTHSVAMKAAKSINSQQVIISKQGKFLFTFISTLPNFTTLGPSPLQGQIQDFEMGGEFL